VTWRTWSPVSRPYGRVTIPTGVALFAAAFLVVSPGLYVDKFADDLSIGVCVALIVVFWGTAFALSGGDHTIAFLWAILFGALLPNDIAGLVLLSAAPLLLIVRLVITQGGLDRIERRVVALVAYAACVWAARLGNTTDLWSLPLYLFLDVLPITLLLLIPRAARSPLHLNLLALGWCAAIGAQLFPLMVKPFALGALSPFTIWYDLNHGTLPRAHYLGVLLILYGVFLGYYGSLRRSWSVLLLLTLVAFGVFVTEAKHAWLAAAGGMAVLGMFLARGRVRWRSLVASTVTLVLVTGLVGQLFAFDDRISLGRSEKYLEWVGASRKIVFIERTSAYLRSHPLDFLVGLGVGSYGSRVASSRATDVLYKEGYRLPSLIPPFTSPPYRNNVSDLFAARHVAAFTGSNVIMNPFSGLVGVIAEFGLLGATLYVALYFNVITLAARVLKDDPSTLWRALAAASVFAIPFLFFLNLFDTYFSQPSVTIPMWYMLGCLCARERMLNGSYELPVDIDSRVGRLAHNIRALHTGTTV